MENSATLKNAAEGPFYLLEAIEQKNLTSFFQPIISIKKISAIGLEAVGRGMDKEKQKLLESQDLYQRLTDNESRLALDRLFRDKGLEGFSQIRAKMPELLLFLNIESSVLTPGIVGSGYLLKKVTQLGLDPNSIVIEISQSENTDSASVQKFIQTQRDNGFLIALEDINNSREKLTQLLLLNPDVVKLEGGLVQEIAKDTHKREGIRTVVNLAQKMGTLVIANGIENEEDALAALDLGVDMLQGGYFSKPQKNDASTLGLKARIVFTASRYRRMMSERMKQDKDRRDKCQDIALSIFEALSGLPPGDMEGKLGGFFKSHPQLECLYLLNQDGVQVSETVSNLKKLPPRKRLLFQPAPRGTDHSLKEYYYALAYNNLTRYLTEPYISLASGSPCITFTGVLPGEEPGKSLILCADIDVSQV